MKAVYLKKYGAADLAFEISETTQPRPQAGQVLIKVEAFGLNFADVMARLGLYKGAPPIPCVLGYDVVGEVVELGTAVTDIAIGDRVTALTKFGGYAEYAIAEQEVTVKIPDTMLPGVAVALATQYCTAFWLSQRMANLQENDHVLIHAASGGVGTALVQMALHRKCKVFGTCSSSSKTEYLKGIGVHHPINYKEKDFEKEVRSINGTKGLDVVFDPVGGKSVKKGFRLLASGGRILSFGVSSMNNAKTIFGKLKILFQFGIYHPVKFLSQSKGMIGVNMLKIAEEQPEKIGEVMRKVVEWEHQGIIQPFVGAEYPIDLLAEAHSFLESRKSMGKIVVKW